MQQYMQLEEIAKNHPKTRERVNKLQAELNHDYLPMDMKKQI